MLTRVLLFLVPLASWGKRLVLMLLFAYPNGGGRFGQPLHSPVLTCLFSMGSDTHIFLRILFWIACQDTTGCNQILKCEMEESVAALVCLMGSKLRVAGQPARLHSNKCPLQSWPSVCWASLYWIPHEILVIIGINWRCHLFIQLVNKSFLGIYNVLGTNRCKYFTRIET